MSKDIMTPESASMSTGSAPQVASNGGHVAITMPTQRPKREIPHTTEYGETYHIGTCYDEEKPKDWDTDDLYVVVTLVQSGVALNQ